MASEKTVYSKDSKWKIEIEAWKNNFFVYKSIGTQVDVYHKEQTTDVWGNDKVDWVKKKAEYIHIKNNFTGDPTGINIVREKSCTNSNHCEQKEWAVGIIKISGSGLGIPQASLIVEKVHGSVKVNIGMEELSGEVEAGSALSDTSIW